MKPNESKVATYLRSFPDSTWYAILVCTCAFFIWRLSEAVIPAIVMASLAIWPLFNKNGRGYYALVLANIASVGSRIGFNNIPTELYITAFSTIGSIFLFLLIHRPSFRLGYLTIPWTLIAASMLISLIYNVVGLRNTELHSNSIFYVMTFFMAILLSIILCCVVRGEQKLFHFSKACVAFGLLIAAETISFFAQNPSILGDRGALVLGWANNANVASMFLCFTIPFFGIQIYYKRWWFAVLVLFVVAAVMFTASRAGYFCLLISAFTMIFLSFRTYGRVYPYICTFFLAAILIVALSLFISHSTWFIKILDAFKDIGFSDNGRNELYQYGINQFKINPFVGTSANALFNINGVNNKYGDISLLHNTFITYMVMGGSVALGCLATYYGAAYYKLFSIKNPLKWHILVLMVMMEFVGSIDNTIVDPLIAGFVMLLFNTIDQPKSKTFDVKQEFFSSYLRN